MLVDSVDHFIVSDEKKRESKSITEYNGFSYNRRMQSTTVWSLREGVPDTSCSDGRYNFEVANNLRYFVYSYYAL